MDLAAWVGYGFMICILAPLMENAIVGPVLKLLGRTGLATIKVCFLSGALWGILHGLLAADWLLPAGAFFALLSYLYLEARSTVGGRAAFRVATTFHIANNALVLFCLGVLKN